MWVWQFSDSNRFDSYLSNKVIKDIFYWCFKSKPARDSEFLTGKHRGWYCRQRPFLASEIPLEWMGKWMHVMLPRGCLRDQGLLSAQCSLKTPIDLLCPCHLSVPLPAKGSAAILTPQCTLTENLWLLPWVTTLIKQVSRFALWISPVALLSAQVLTGGRWSAGAWGGHCWACLMLRQQKWQKQRLC